MPRYDPIKHRRRSIRLQGYDYATPGAYFVTAVVKNRECLFGETVNGQIHLNDYGMLVKSSWDDLPHHYSHVALDAFIVMPNHVHGIIVLTSDDVSVGVGLRPTPTDATIRKRHPLSEIVRAFKSFSARRINELRDTTGIVVWQRNYYEHIVRNEQELDRIRRYINTNPIRWDYDRENRNTRSAKDRWRGEENIWFSRHNLKSSDA